jgi:uncharacterized protein (DUF2225 family)
MPARPLSIVAAALDGRAPAVRSLVEGEVVCREGDPPGPLYVICSGSVRAYRRSLTTPEAIEDLAVLGPGEVVGEMAPILSQPRSATLQAIEPTQVLEVPATQVGPLLRRHGSLLRVLTLALKHRAGVSPEELGSIAARLGVRVPQDGPDGEAPALVFAAPEHDASLVYPKSVSCPACAAQFFVLMVHPRSDRPTSRSTDFHQVYRPPFNPYDYEVWVCPNDLYAALPSDFADLSEVHRSCVNETVGTVLASRALGRPEFNVMRNLDLRELALELALALYRMRGLPSARVAAVLHRLAWCARERGDTGRERDWLLQAVEAYTATYNGSDLGSARDELRVLYLCGELTLRLGDHSAAIRWFNEGVQHPQVKQHGNWERLLREQWATARELAGAEG